MSGETEADVSGWTVDTLKQHVDRIFAEHEKAVGKALEVHDKRVAESAGLIQQLITSEIEHVRELIEERFRAETTAITKAETANEKRFESVNEFRAQLADQSASFLSRNEYEAKHEALIQRIDAVEKLNDQSHGREAGVRMSAGAMIGALTAAVAVLGIIITLANLLTGS